MSRMLGILIGLLLILKIVLAAVFPVFGDEAYYQFWGSHVSGGYYDLPPMIGWWLWPLLKISGFPLWTRVFNLLAPVLISFGMNELLTPSIGKQRARLTALLFFMLPLPFITVISFPDLPLMFFGFLSSLLFFRGVKEQKGPFSLMIMMSGALWGSAFLSKYFSVFLIPAFLIYAWPISRHRLGGIVSFVLGASPFLFQHGFWNSGHCWANFVFNLITRQKAFEGTVASTTGFYLVHLLVVSLPVALSGFHRAARTEPEQSDLADELKRFFLMLWAIPVVVFGLTALMGRGQGLHWLLFLSPFFVAWCGLAFDSSRIRIALYNSMAISGIIAGVMSVAFADPARWLSSIFERRFHFDYSLITHPQEFISVLGPEIQNAKAVFTWSYSISSVIHQDLNRFLPNGPSPVLGVLPVDSRYGRVFDWMIDWKVLEGETVVFLKLGKQNPDEYSSWFKAVKIIPVTFEGSDVLVIRGSGFRAISFWREKVLPELKIYYPPFLPGACSIKQVDHAD